MAANLGLVQGRYDFISGLHPAYMEDLMDENGDLAEKHRSQLDLYKIPFLKTDYIGVLLDSDNAGDSALQSSIMRRALSMSIDRKSIAKNLRRNSVLPSDRFVPPMMPGASSYKSPIYDPQTAQSIL